jgi:hypothetical protein
MKKYGLYKEDIGKKPKIKNSQFAKLDNSIKNIDKKLYKSLPPFPQKESKIPFLKQS